MAGMALGLQVLSTMKGTVTPEYGNKAWSSHGHRCEKGKSTRLHPLEVSPPSFFFSPKQSFCVGTQVWQGNPGAAAWNFGIGQFSLQSTRFSVRMPLVTMITTEYEKDRTTETSASSSRVLPVHLLQDVWKPT